METKEQTKINWGGLVETVESLPDGKEHDNEYLNMLKRLLSMTENTTSYTGLKNNLSRFTKKDCDYLCSPLLDSLIKLSVERAAEDNNLTAIKFLIKREVRPGIDDLDLAWACAHHNIEMLNYLIPYHTIINPQISSAICKACEFCVNYDSLECLQILVQKYGVKCITSEVITRIFSTNNMRFVEYIHSVASSAISEHLRNKNSLLTYRDTIEAVHFLVSNSYMPLHDIPAATEIAACHNLIKTFKYLTSVNPNIKNSMVIAIKNNHMQIVKYIVEDMKQPITIEHLKIAIDKDLEVFIRYFLEKNVENIEEALFYAVSNKKMKIAELLRLELCRKSYV